VVKEWLEIDRAGFLPDGMDLKILLISPLDKVLHTYFLVSLRVKIVHRCQTVAIRQMIIVFPAEFVSLYISGRHKKYLDVLTGDIFPELLLLQKLHNTALLNIILLPLEATGLKSARFSIG